MNRINSTADLPYNGSTTHGVSVPRQVVLAFADTNDLITALGMSLSQPIDVKLTNMGSRVEFTQDDRLKKLDTPACLKCGAGVIE